MFKLYCFYCNNDSCQQAELILDYGCLNDDIV